ncbi:CapA family protein [Qipengyuania atrilutea]|uniref:CapA family protein n=1 Tax=Qipengyuania atrilutea TaxID=2744473 RepID=A0A850GZQ8_9SPHN|nr:CapA family protein [Actirhodobacter atriluteus]NVD43966.1 CapA family protein [Actirhodobacter atriluteus]
MREFLKTVLRLLVGVVIVAVQAPALAHPADEMVGGPLAEAKVSISGVLDGRRDRIAFGEGVELAVNDTKAALSPDGHFAAVVRPSQYYALTVRGPTIFETRQTFGHAELYRSDCECLAVPAIEIVARKKGRIELFFGGDSMAGRRYFEPRSDGMSVLTHANLDSDLDKLLVHMKPYWNGSDLTSINLESVVADTEPGPPAPKKYLFFTPTAAPKALARSGIDHVSLGNNHTADYRAAGLATTISALDEAGVAFSGAGMDVHQAEAASIFRIGKQSLAIYGFVGWRGNWTPNQTATETKAGAAWGTQQAVERITRHERRAGHIPIMQFHGNLEYGDRPSALSLPRFRGAIEKGAPVVIGHHPHVTHGLEIYRGGLIAHSLGNFLFDQDHPHTQVSYGLKVWLENGKFLRAEAIPIQLLDYRPVPATDGMRQASLRRLYWLSAEMGTQLLQSGGHAVVWNRGTRTTRAGCTKYASTSIADFGPVCREAGAEFGRNMVPRGDFENALVGEARDRFWRSENAGFEFASAGPGTTHLQILPEDASDPVYLYSQSYIRDVYATRFTLEARVRTSRALKINLLIKDRPMAKDSPSRSRSGDQIAETSVPASEDWQTIRFDFERPPDASGEEQINAPGAARAFRPILEFAIEAGAPMQAGFSLDDIALIEWPDQNAQADPAKAWLWTHRGMTQQAALDVSAEAFPTSEQ